MDGDREAVGFGESGGGAIGLKLVVKNHEDVTVTAGDVVHLPCPLIPSSDALQIMWQKLEPEETVILATCLRTERRVRPGLADISGAGLRGCDLEFHNVKKKDQGCYQCLLITPSDVAHAAKICLWIQESHGLNPAPPGLEEVVPSSEEAAGQSDIPVPHDRVLWAVPCSVVGVVLVAGAVCLLLCMKHKNRATGDKTKTVEDPMKTPTKNPMNVDNVSARKRRTPQTPRRESHNHSPLLCQKLFIESINENQQR